MEDRDDSPIISQPDTKTDEFRLQNYRAMENRLLSANSDVKHLKQEITRLKAELEKERELRKELAWNDAIDAVKDMLVVQMEDEENEGLAALHNAYKKLEELKHKQP